MNLLEKKEGAILTATFWFSELMKLSNEIRNDDKERTGIQVFAWEPGTRNFIYFPVGEPSEAAQIFAIEKAVRSNILGDASSQNSQDISKLRFPGSVTVIINGVTIVVSVSGLQSHEDVFVAIQVLAGIFNETTSSICLSIVEKGGRLPTFNHWYEKSTIVTMRKIGHKNQLRLYRVRQRNINPDVLVKKYGIRFVGILIEYLTKTEKVGPGVRPAIYPQIKKFRWDNEKQAEQYFEDLEEAGFKIKNKPEDFIDEDTGQIVTLQRKFLYYLKK